MTHTFPSVFVSLAFFDCSATSSSDSNSICIIFRVHQVFILRSSPFSILASLSDSPYTFNLSLLVTWSDFSKVLFFLSSCLPEFLLESHTFSMRSSFPSGIFMMYTKFFAEVSWVVSVDTSSSAPNCKLSTGMFKWVPIFVVCLVCVLSSISSALSFVASY